MLAIVMIAHYRGLRRHDEDALRLARRWAKVMGSRSPGPGSRGPGAGSPGSGSEAADSSAAGRLAAAAVLALVAAEEVRRLRRSGGRNS